MFVTERHTGLKHVIISPDSREVSEVGDRRVITDLSGARWNSGAHESLNSSRVAWRLDFSDSDSLTVRWMNEDGFGSAPFNADYFVTDPWGYLDAIRKGKDMEDLHIVNAAGDDVTQQYL